jgi:hypothetical protein
MVEVVDVDCGGFLRAHHWTTVGVPREGSPGTKVVSNLRETTREKRPFEWTLVDYPWAVVVVMLDDALLMRTSLI